MEILQSKVALSNALSGAAADAFSTVMLYPLDSIKIKVQADSSKSLKEVVKETLTDHPLEMFRGVESKVFQGVQQKFQYFYVYALLKELYVRKSGGKPTVPVDLLFGYLAAFQGLFTTLPLEVTNTRIITSKKKKNPAEEQSSSKERTPGFMEVFMDQWETEGFASFYRTLSASAILCINPAISFTVFEEIKGKLLARRNSTSDVLSTFEAFVVGIISKAIATIITFPFIRAKVVMSVWKKRQEELAQSCKTPDQTEADHQVQPGMMDTIRAIIDMEGFSGLYVGLEPQLIKAVTNAALMLAMKERIYELVKRVIIG